MARGSKKKKGVKGSNMVAKLTDDILVDIISRLPYKATCCCKCVSRRWRDLFSQPDHRKKLPQPLAGFFYKSLDPIFYRCPYRARCFANASGESFPRVHPSLSFVPEYKSLDIVDCCNGLLLCRCWKVTDFSTMDYIVCNPATRKWAVVPGSVWPSESHAIAARLGFDPAVSSHFHVFEFVVQHDFIVDEDDSFMDDGCFPKVAFYSSKTGVWIHRNDVRTGYQVHVPINSKSVFLGGVFYMSALDKRVIAVDLEANNWRVIPTPIAPYRKRKPDGIYLSNGQVHFAHKGGSELSIWALDDCNSEHRTWTLKHNVSYSRLFPEENSPFWHYRLISIHTEHSMILMVCGWENILMSYDMDSMELRKIRELGWDCKPPYFPYVPLFSESLGGVH